MVDEAVVAVAATRNVVRRASLIVVASLFTAGCGGEAGFLQTTSERMGFINASVRLITSDGLTITRVHVDVRPANVTQDLTYDASSDQYTGIITAPTGTQTVTATAYAGSLLVGSGTGVATVTRHGTATLLIKILDNAAAGRGQDHGPIITGLTASTLTPMAGDVVDLAVTASDPDGNALSYQWTQDCTGTFGTPTAASSTWSSDVVQPCIITATVKSNGLSDTAQISMAVQNATGGVQLSATFIPTPYVSSVSLNGAGLSCSISRDATDASCRPAIAGSATLAATVTFDAMPPDSGGAVTLSDNCGGSASATSLDLAGGTASFSWVAPATTASCLITATAARDGLSDAQQVAVAVK